MMKGVLLNREHFKRSAYELTVNIMEQSGQTKGKLSGFVLIKVNIILNLRSKN